MKASRIGFIDVLYVILAGLVLNRITLAASFDNGARVFLLAVLFEDYLAYHESTVLQPHGRGTYSIGAFCLDIVLLMTWYVCDLAIESWLIVVPISLSSFFALKALWELVCYPEIRGLRFLYKSHIPLAILGLTFTWAFPPSWALIGLAVSWLLFTPVWWRFKCR